MTTTTTADPLARLHRFTVEQYERMLAAGLPNGGRGVELSDGVVVYKDRWRDGVPVPCRFTVEEYDRLIPLGILREGAKIELIRGEVRAKMGQGDPHGLAVEALTRLLLRLLPDQYGVRCQLPVVFPDSEPEPDFVICAPAPRRGNRHPRPEHVHLAIEVAATSLRLDRTETARLFAGGGVPVYWIVNLVDRRIEVYTDPVTPPDGDPHYRTQTHYTPG